MEGVPAYVSIVFILTTFASIAIFLHALKSAGTRTFPSRLLLFLLPFWICLTGVLAASGFYLSESAAPPRIFLFGVFPTLCVIALYLAVFGKSFVDRLPLRTLTLLHVVRVPVELVLYWLAHAGQVPRVMTFEGQNFDIASGVLAIVVYAAAFRSGKPNKWVLWVFNLIGLALLANIVTTAVLSLPGPMQSMSFDEPNRAVLYFPYVWLPTIVVPLVLFSHLAACIQLARGRTD